MISKQIGHTLINLIRILTSLQIRYKHKKTFRSKAHGSSYTDEYNREKVRKISNLKCAY